MILNKWHAWLDMPKYDKSWHENDIQDELEELHESTGQINKWSELSDVAYTYSRGKWSGHDLSLPISKLQYCIGLFYMYPKYTLRYLFFKRAGQSINSNLIIKEVRNPKKTHKLHFIAQSYGIDKSLFQKQCEKQLKYWPLLP